MHGISRSSYLDNLKVFLTVLVIFHHAGQAYGPTGGFWFYSEPARAGCLGMFFALNASFFMGLFFFISGYFVQRSFERRGAAVFLKERTLRYGVPVLLAVLVMQPLLMYVYHLHYRFDSPFIEYYLKYYIGFAARPEQWPTPFWPDLNFGHLWFVEHLLVWSVIYAGYRKLLRRPKCDSHTVPRFWPALGLVTLVALVTLVVRGPLGWPIDRWTGFLGFIQMEPAHLPQYATMMVLGIAAGAGSWVEKIRTRTGYLLFACGLLLALLMIISGFLPHGRPLWLWPLIETFFCFSISAGLLVVFRQQVNVSSSLCAFGARYAYITYFVHVPVLVVLQYALADLNWAPTVKFLLCGSAGVVCSWGLGWLLCLVSPVRRIFC